MLKNKAVKFLMPMFSLFLFCNFINANATIIQKKIKVTFVGDMGTGKTYFRKALQGFSYREIADTNQTEYVTKSKCIIHFGEDREKQLELQMVDCTGNGKYSEQIRCDIAKNSNFIVIAIDPTEKPGNYNNIILKNATEWYNALTELSTKQGYNAYFIFLGTKSDEFVYHPEDCAFTREQFENKLRSVAELSNGTAKYVISQVAGEDKGGIRGVQEFKDAITSIIRETGIYDTLPDDSKKEEDITPPPKPCSIL